MYLETNKSASSCIYKNALFLKICHQHSPFIITRLNSFKMSMSIMYVNADIIWVCFLESYKHSIVYQILLPSELSAVSSSLCNQLNQRWLHLCNEYPCLLPIFFIMFHLRFNAYLLLIEIYA